MTRRLTQCSAVFFHLQWQLSDNALITPHADVLGPSADKDNISHLSRHTCARFCYLFNLHVAYRSRLSGSVTTTTHEPNGTLDRPKTDYDSVNGQGTTEGPVGLGSLF